MDGQGQELKSMTTDPSTYAEVSDEVADQGSSRQSQRHEDHLLRRLGKRPVLKRTFGFMSILGFSCTILVTWEGSMVTFLEAFKNGGPAGVIYSYLFVWAGTFATFTTMGELASMAPTSGGQYHWTSMLAPRAAHKFYSFLAGWLTVLGWQAAVASSAYLSGSLIQGLVVLAGESYSPQPWQTTLVIWAVIAFGVVINVAVSGLLPKFEGVILIIHLLGFFAVLIPLVYMGDHNTAEFVFTTFINGGHWQTQGLSFFVGIVGSMFAFMGADAAVHMAEEIRHASVMVPRSILTSLALNGSLGFAMILATLFALTNVDDAMNSPTGYPFMEIFYQATHSRGGSTVMAAIVTAMMVTATVGAIASSSRMIWSFARDRGMPGWRVLSKVDPRTAIPMYAVAVATVVGCLLALIVIGSETVFNDVISLSVSSLYTSYLLCACLLLYRRCTGGILSETSEASHAVRNTAGAQLVWGPFHVPGIWGVFVNSFAVVYLVVGVFFSLWPPDRFVTSSSMNFSVVGTGGVVLLSTLYFIFVAKRKYTGPVVEVGRA